MVVSEYPETGYQRTYQIQNRHFHHTLVKICRLIFDDLDGYNLLRFQILAFHNLPEGSLAQNIENQVAIPK